jgi:hypothetical protein
MVKTFDILLDLEKELYSPSSLLFSISRNDFNTVQLNFVITQDGTPIDLLNKTVELAIKKPSGLTVYQACEITSAQEGKAKITLNQQAYIEYGIYTAEVYIRDTNQLAVTNPFWYQSRTPIFNETTEEAIQSSNDWSALQEALFAYDLRPQITEGFPTITPEYIGQMAFDRINKITYIASDLTSNSWRTFGAVEGEGGGGNDTIFGDNPLNFTPARIGQIFIDEINEDAYIAIGATAEDWEQINNEDFVKQAIIWGEILEKPVAFPPEIHTHTKAQITDFAHNHDWAEITGKPTTFAPEAHNHNWVDIQGMPLAFPPEEHGHTIDEVIGLQDALDLKADDSDLTTKANVADVYTKLETYNKIEVDTIVTGITEGGGTLVEDNLNSNSSSSALSANQGRILNETKADINHSHDYAPNSHSHIVQEIEGLQAELDSKADINHSHTWGEITEKPTTFAPDIHTHEMGEINGLQGALDLKADDTDLAGKADINHNHDSLYATLNHNHDSLYATLNHNHDSLYAPINHNHDVLYAPINHNHEIDAINGLQTALDSKVDDNDLNGLKLWSGTQAQYDAIGAKDATTLYFVTG